MYGIFVFKLTKVFKAMKIRLGESGNKVVNECFLSLFYISRNQLYKNGCNH